MGILEVVLIIVGSIILVLSFVLPVNKKESTAGHVPKMYEGLIKSIIEKEIKDAGNHINEVVDETVTYSMEKTERGMERLTNEKIMMINEYSEQVLGEIHKNHQEVMFLYDMLNDKHEILINTVSEASKKAQEIKNAEVAAEAPAEAPDKKIKSGDEAGKNTVVHRAADMAEDTFVPIAPEKIEAVTREILESPVDLRRTDGQSDEDSDGIVKSTNNNEKILRMHKLGKSKTEIARELGLGVGEVKLVINLFEQTL